MQSQPGTTNRTDLPMQSSETTDADSETPGAEGLRGAAFFLADTFRQDPSRIADTLVFTTQEEVAVSDRPKIIGGEEADPRDFPFVAALAVNLGNGTVKQYCGAFFVSPTVLMTAAHCDVRRGHVVILGTHDLSRGKPVDSSNMRKVRTITATSGLTGSLRRPEQLIHEEYDPSTKKADLSFIRIERPYTGPLPAHLAESPGELVGRFISTFGWGVSNTGTRVFQKLRVMVLDFDLCRKAYEHIGPGAPTPSNGTFCAGGGVRDACRGDSGSPALVGQKVAGVVSQGALCMGRPNGVPGIYTALAVYDDWVTTNATLIR